MHSCKSLLCASGHGPQACVLKTGKGPPPTTAIKDLLPWPGLQICPRKNILAKPQIILRDVTIGFQGLSLRVKSTNLKTVFLSVRKSGMWTPEIDELWYGKKPRSLTVRPWRNDRFPFGVAYFQGRTVKLPGRKKIWISIRFCFPGSGKKSIRKQKKRQIHFSVACWNLSEYSRSGGLQDQAGRRTKKETRQQKKHLLKEFCALVQNWAGKKMVTKSTKHVVSNLDQNDGNIKKTLEKHPILFGFFFLCVLTFPCHFVCFVRHPAWSTSSMSRRMSERFGEVLPMLGDGGWGKEVFTEKMSFFFHIWKYTKLNLQVHRFIVIFEV